jgi:hypothetical protein
VLEAVFVLLEYSSPSRSIFIGSHSGSPLRSFREKPSEQPHPKPKPKVMKFHCDYCGRDGHKSEFCFKRKREERMAKEWANKDKYHPSNGVLEPRV